MDGRDRLAGDRPGWSIESSMELASQNPGAGTPAVVNAQAILVRASEGYAANCSQVS